MGGYEPDETSMNASNSTAGASGQWHTVGTVALAGCSRSLGGGRSTFNGGPSGVSKLTAAMFTSTYDVWNARRPARGPRPISVCTLHMGCCAKHEVKSWSAKVAAGAIPGQLGSCIVQLVVRCGTSTSPSPDNPRGTSESRSDRDDSDRLAAL